MKSHDAAKFAGLMTALGELYGKAISESLSEIYWETLKSYTWEQVKEATTRHTQNPERGSFMPKPADIIRHLEGSIENRALTAWSSVVDSMRAIGSYESISFDDSLINAVIRDLGGWVRLCQCTNNEIPFLAREFQKRYAGYVENPPANCPPYLTGLLQNQKQQLCLPTPVRISDCRNDNKLLTHQNLQPEILAPPDKNNNPEILGCMKENQPIGRHHVKSHANF